MKLVIVESPFAGNIPANITYAKQAMLHSLLLGEAPFASHLLYPQPGILRDEIAGERELGIKSGDAWRAVAHLTAFYTDLGWSPGMLAALRVCREAELTMEFRAMSGPIKMPSVWSEDLAFMEAQVMLGIS